MVIYVLPEFMIQDKYQVNIIYKVLFKNYDSVFFIKPVTNASKVFCVTFFVIILLFDNKRSNK